MYIHKLGRAAYEAAQAELVRIGWQEPLCASYYVDIRVDSSLYHLCLQPIRNSQIAVIQAVRVFPDPQGKEKYELLTTPGLLNSLLDLWLFPVVKKNQ